MKVKQHAHIMCEQEQSCQSDSRPLQVSHLADGLAAAAVSDAVNNKEATCGRKKAVTLFF